MSLLFADCASFLHSSLFFSSSSSSSIASLFSFCDVEMTVVAAAAIVVVVEVEVASVLSDKRSEKIFSVAGFFCVVERSFSFSVSHKKFIASLFLM